MNLLKCVFKIVYKDHNLSFLALLALLICSFDDNVKSMFDWVIFKDCNVFPILTCLTALTCLIISVLLCWWFFLSVSCKVISLSRGCNFDITIFDKSIAYFDLTPQKEVTRYRLFNTIRMLCFLIIIMSFHRNYLDIIHHLFLNYWKYQLFFKIFPFVLVTYLFVFKKIIKNKI